MHPLNRIRILDLGRVLSGPYCAALLGDLGAEIIKIEPPHGDDSREMGPFSENMSVYFSILNRGKRAIQLDLKQTEQRNQFLTLADQADVMIENFRPGVTERLGIDYATVSRRNPRLVYTSVSGYGQTGARSERPAYDLIIQALSGLMERTGWPDGQPTKVGESIADVTTGLIAAWYTTVALFERTHTGRGRHLDISMLETSMALQVTAQALVNVGEGSDIRTGNRHPISTPFDTFTAQDGTVALAVANNAIFARLSAMMDRPELANDPRFASDVQRTVHRVDLERIITAWMSDRRVQEIEGLAHRFGVPCGPIQTFAEALQHLRSERPERIGRIQGGTAGPFEFIPIPYDEKSPLSNVSAPATYHQVDQIIEEWGAGQKEQDS